MKLFIVGAPGKTGKWILKAALARGHQVTALVRAPADRLQIKHPLLKVIEGDLLELDNLQSVLSGHDAVVSSLNSAMVDDGTRVLVAAAQATDVLRFIGIAGGGILQLDETRLRRDRDGYPEMFRKSSDRHLSAWKTLEVSKIKWTLFCTPDLLDAPATGYAKIRLEYMPEGGNSVAAGDVAEFVMNELASNEYLNKRVGCTT